MVEVDPGVSRAILLSLRTAGLDPVHVSSGAAALQTLNAIHVEAVVIDPDLPDDLGGRVLDRLREAGEPPRKPIPWVVVSAQDFERVTALYGPIGDRFLAKPFDPWRLVDMLQNDD